MKFSLKKLHKNYFFPFVAISFVIISTSSLIVTGTQTTEKTQEQIIITYKPRLDLPTVPVLKTNNFPVLSAQGVIALDLDTGNILYEKNADQELLPASTTKIMTSLVAMDHYDPSEVITVGNFWVEGQKMRLFTGEKITIQSLLDGLLIYSANDAAEVLAANYPGGREAFVDAMNQKAKLLGLHNTTFKNPSGLDEEGHVSTARDMVKLSSYAMARPWFRDTVKTKEKIVTSADGLGVHKLTNVNTLLGTTEGVLGIKTGWTEAARENLVTYVIRQDKPVILALLGSQDRFGETKELIEWIYNDHDWEPIMEPVYTKSISSIN